MNNKKLNCHVEPKRQLRVETAQQIYISPRDIAENAKLNHEIADELRKYKTNHQLPSSGLPRGSRSNKDSLATWIPASSTGMTRIFCLTIFTLFPTFAQAETCTATPDCKSLGYTETSCPDGGGVKCPWNTSLMYCCKKCAPSCEEKSCQVGDVLYADKKCYTCPNANTLPGQVPIGVMFSSGKAVALTDLSGTMNWSHANSACSSYSVGGVSGWYLPSKDELLAMYSNHSRFVQGFSNAIGGKDFVSGYYWSSSNSNSSNYGYWIVSPVSGNSYDHWYDNGNNYYVRPVLTF